MVPGPAGRGGPGGDPDLAENVGQVPTHRLFTDDQGIRHLAVAGTGGDECQDFALPGRQATPAVGGAAGTACATLQPFDVGDCP
ncbi:hypothetical protein D9M72_656230 [compost metagenome]